MYTENFYPFKIHYNNMGHSHWRERERERDLTCQSLCFSCSRK